MSGPKPAVRMALGMVLALALALAGGLAACGKKGALEPPPALAAQAALNE